MCGLAFATHKPDVVILFVPDRRQAYRVFQTAEEAFDLHDFVKACHSLGFGYVPKKGSKARQYFDDLVLVISLYTTCNPPAFREGYIEEAWPMIHKLSQQLICLSAYKRPQWISIVVECEPGD